MNRKEKLLILCCHGVYHQGKFYAERQEKSVYENHLRESINALRKGEYDALIISGGYTKPQIEGSEARGYLDWADDIGIDRAGITIILEEYARSSVENLLFSMCRFYQYFGYFPKEVSISTLVWKNNWFEKVIGNNLRLPNICFLKIKGEEEKLPEIKGAVLPNRDEVAEKNMPDPLERLSAKKVQQRDPWKKGNPYVGLPELKEIFEVLDQMEREKSSSLPVDFKFPWED